MLEGLSLFNRHPLSVYSMAGTCEHLTPKQGGVFVLMELTCQQVRHMTNKQVIFYFPEKSCNGALGQPF